MPKSFEHWVTQPIKTDFDKPLASIELKGVEIHFSQLSTLSMKQIAEKMQKAIDRYKVRNN